MDVRRGALIALAACAACSPAGASPAESAAAAGAPAGMPATWKVLPPIALAAAKAARIDDVAVDSGAAWGDPARGCYAVQLAMHGGTAPAATLAEQVIDGLAGSKPAAGSAGSAGGAVLTFSEVVKPPAGSDTLSFTFARPPYHGRARARLGAGQLTVLACFGNQRDPARCDAACGQMLQSSP